MRRVRVSSSNVESIGYDKKQQLMEIAFKTRRVYQYEDVPPAVHKSLMSSYSKGRFVNRKIGTKYPYRKV